MSLVNQCENLIDASTNLIDWLKTNEPDVSSSVKRNIHRQREQAKKLKNAASSNMTLGIFGESQAGKSYLVEEMAKDPKNKKLIVVLGKEEKNFLTEINYEGGSQSESTGLVTRFTVDPIETPDGFPISVKLLSQTNFIKILINSYFEDFSLGEKNIPKVDDFKNLEQKLKQNSSNKNVDCFLEKDVDDLRVYMEEIIKPKRTDSKLWDFFDQSDYWEIVGDLAPKLDLEDRIEVLSILWGKVGAFSEYFALVYEVLKQLNFETNVFCSSDALFPRNKSVIQVGCLKKVAEGWDDQVQVCNNSKDETYIPKYLLATIIEELEFQISEASSPFFKYTDLLDFPGARSRKMWENPDEILSNPDNLGEAILRGKVAYLFENYTLNFGVNGLLLCIKPGNQEIQTLPDYVGRWIDVVQGETAEYRSGKSTALFLVFTKFDLRIQTLTSTGADKQNVWNDTIKNSLLEFYGRSGNWVTQWDNQKGFNNIFWLRNPEASSALVSKDKNGKEISFTVPDLINEIKEIYLKDDLIQKHVNDPETAYDAALKFNDGGIGYLRDKLSNVFVKELKNAQIEHRILKVKNTLTDIALQFYIKPNDFDEQRKKRIQEVEVVTNLVAKGEKINNPLLGKFLSELMVAEEDLEDYLRTGRTDISKIASESILYWHDRKLDAFRNSKTFILNFGFVEEANISIINRELLDGIKTYNIQEKIETQLNKISRNVNFQTDRWYKPAAIASNILNNFIFNLGEEKNDSEINDENFYEDLSLEEEQDDILFSSWFKKLLILVEKNCGSLQGRDPNSKSNVNLGKILENLGLNG